jgi:hypothetical protein
MKSTTNTKEEQAMETVVIEKGRKGDTSFDGWKWLLKARSNDETRPVLNLVAISAKRAVTCDGCRAHFLNVKAVHPTAIKPGLYKVLADTAKQIVLQEQSPEETGAYPDIKQVLPRHMKHAIDLFGAPWGTEGNGLGWVAAKVIRALPEDKVINLNFLKDCVDKDTPWTFYPNKSGAGPMYFKNYTRSAIIMPARA